MNEFWGLALSVAGIGAIGAFVFWSLYKQWLTLPIFQQLTKKQLFILFVLFLVLTFVFAIAALGAYVYTHENTSPQQEYSFWSRTKTGAGPFRVIRHSFSTGDECIRAEKLFEPSRLLLINYGCSDPAPDMSRLQLDCQNKRLVACEMLRELGLILGVSDARDDESNLHSADTEIGDWRFWSAYKDGSLNDERFNNKSDCLILQAKWDQKTYGNIIFPCSKVDRQLLRRATEECLNGKEFSCEWKLRLERALSGY